jgi:fumarate hydratase class II
MPGKVNPVIPESVMMVCAHVIGSDTTITIGGMNGNFELNTFLPIIGYHIVNSINLLAAGAENFAKKCIDGITPNVSRMRELVEWSLALSTPLALKIGYDKAAEMQKIRTKRQNNKRNSNRRRDFNPRRSRKNS